MTAPLRLEYIALALDDPAATFRLFNYSLGLPEIGFPASGGAVRAGDVTLGLFERGDPRLGEGTHRGVHHLGFAGEPSQALVDRLAEVPKTQCLSGPQWRFADSVPPGGVHVRFGADTTAPGATANGGCDAQGAQATHVERVDHIGIASVDNRAAEQLFCTELAFPIESRQTDMEVRTVVESFTSDTYGVIYHSRPPEPVGGLRVSFVTVGDCELEFLEEVDAHAMSGSRAKALGHQAGTTRQDQGAIGRYVERQGPGLHHLALKTPDLAAALLAMADDGAQLIDSVGRPGSRGAQIAFVHPRSTGGLLLHLVERTPL
jgi:catechol 2,3-dioxygenase-like lactoylglutathione lyase family enzyme